jgi:hypothetical protein
VFLFHAVLDSFWPSVWAAQQLTDEEVVGDFNALESSIAINFGV